MKVAVITRHAISNYGSLLQALATQQIIEKLGHTCEIIDYVRTDEDYSQWEKTALQSKPRWNRTPLTKSVYLAIRQKMCIQSGQRFEAQRNRYLHLTQRYSSLQALELDKPDADVYMTGSDQVWGKMLCGCYDNAYCLSFTSNSDKRISYAASFGTSEFSEAAGTDFTHWLSRFDHLTVREESGRDYLNALGLDSIQVLDPTLLLEREAWEQYMQPISQKKPYVLVYQLHNDKRLGAYAKKAAKAMGLQLIRISPSFHQVIREGKMVWAPEMGEFLSYIQNAQCLITDSFHGTAFAIGLNIPFVEILPNNDTSTRNLNLLELTGLSDRILTDMTDVSLAQKKVDYTPINEIIQRERQRSISELKRIIET